MTIQEFRSQEMANVIWDTEKPKIYGGQHCGVQRLPIIAMHEDFQLKITVGVHRSRYENKNLARTLMELAIDDYYDSRFN